MRKKRENRCERRGKKEVRIEKRDLEFILLVAIVLLELIFEIGNIAKLLDIDLPVRPVHLPLSQA